MASDSQRIRDLERQVSDLMRRTPTAGLGNPTVSTAFGSSFTRPYQVGFPAILTSTYDSSTGYSWAIRILSQTAAELIDPAIPLTGDSAVEINGSEDLAVGTPVWLEPDPAAGGYIFQATGTLYRTDCIGGVNVRYLSLDGGTTWSVDSYQGCCSCGSGEGPPPVLTCGACTTVPFTLYLQRVSGCGTDECTSPIAVDGAGPTSWLKVNAFSGIGEPPDCVNIDRIYVYCTGGAFFVDITRSNPSTGDAATHIALAVTVSACSPFCATFTVPADAVCASDSNYTLSNSPSTSCGGGGGGIVPYELATGTGSGAGSATVTLAGVNAPANSLVIVTTTATVATAGDPLGGPTVNFDGLALTELNNQDSTADDVHLSTSVLTRAFTAADIGTVSVTWTCDPMRTVSVVVIVEAVTGLVNFTADRTKTAVGTASAPATGTSAATTVAAEYVHAAMGAFDITPPADGAWGGSFTEGTTVTFNSPGAGHMTLRTGYRILSATGTFAASVAETRDNWTAQGISFS